MNLTRLSNNPALRALARKCWPKEQHESEGAADAAARSLLKRNLEKGVTLHSYKCPHCGSWHTGHGEAR